MSKLTELDRESLKKIVDARAKAVELAQTAQAAMKDARIAELEFKNTIHEVYIEQGLDKNCNIDVSTGAITWPEPVEDKEEVASE